MFLLPLAPKPKGNKMHVKFYEKQGECFAQVIKDGGFVIAEGSGKTPEEALQGLCGTVNSQIETLTKTCDLLNCMEGK
jgi:hypothetical protein